MEFQTKSSVTMDPNFPLNNSVTLRICGNSTIGQEFNHRTHSSAYPQSKGKAENAVKSAKQLMRKAEHSGQDPWLAVLDFRNTPSSGIGESPCQRQMNH